MNKKELEAKLRNYEERLKDITKAIKETREQLAEPEKPKLRHGDFGLNNLGYPRLILQSKDEELFDAGKLYCDRVDGGYAHPLPDPILGNIFDLMEGWSEPFKEYDADKYATGIRVKGKKIKIYACTGDCEKEKCYCSFFLDEAKGFYNALGHAIAELKQKENKE